MKTLVTGGAGYIGTHLLVELLSAGHDVVVVDNFSSGYIEGLKRAQEISGRSIRLFHGDVADLVMMRQALRGVEVVFHLAAYKKVGESMRSPESYFRNNLGSMTVLLEAMAAEGVHRIVYSSTAAVYGQQSSQPISEDSPTRPDSPYGFSKLQGEQLLDWMVRLRGWSAVSLRYFNPVGAHPSGQIGEPFQQATSLVPCALKVLAAQADNSQADNQRLTIFGTNYDTPDGTCLRDYIHVCDLARAHLSALKALSRPGHHIFNVGCGRGYSVREVLDACARVTDRRVPHVIGDRRPGDVPVAVADVSRFRNEMGFMPWFGLDKMVASAWRWWQDNPDGYVVSDDQRWVRPGGQAVVRNLMLIES